MRLSVFFPITIISLIVILVAGCKKDDEEEELIWPEPYVPEWLVPYMGNYSGTYDGDEEGTWKCYIEGYISFYIHFVSSADSSKTFYLVELTDSGSFTHHADSNWMSGTITETGQVSGRWQHPQNNQEGAFVGSKITKRPIDF